MWARLQRASVAAPLRTGLASGAVLVRRSHKLAALGSDFGAMVALLMQPEATERVDNLLLSAALIASRKEARPFLREHTVTARTRRGAVERVSSAATHVDPTTLVVNGEPLDHPAPLHLVMNKPRGYACTHSLDESPTVYELLPTEFLARRPLLHTVGRLDRMSSGLLLFTQSGELSQRLTAPTRKVLRSYVVRLDQPLSSDGQEVAAFASGALELVDGYVCRPARLEPHPTDPHFARVSVWEGQFHQVRRMFAAVGRRVLALQRTNFGDLALSQLRLQEGEWRPLHAHELRALLVASHRERKSAHQRLIESRRLAALEAQGATRPASDNMLPLEADDSIFALPEDAADELADELADKSGGGSNSFNHNDGHNDANDASDASDRGWVSARPHSSPKSGTLTGANLAPLAASPTEALARSFAGTGSVAAKSFELNSLPAENSLGDNHEFADRARGHAAAERDLARLRRARWMVRQGILPRDADILASSSDEDLDLSAILARARRDGRVGAEPTEPADSDSDADSLRADRSTTVKTEEAPSSTGTALDRRGGRRRGRRRTDPGGSAPTKQAAVRSLEDTNEDDEKDKANHDDGDDGDGAVVDGEMAVDWDSVDDTMRPEDRLSRRHDRAPPTMAESRAKSAFGSREVVYSAPTGEVGSETEAELDQLQRMSGADPWAASEALLADDLLSDDGDEPTPGRRGDARRPPRAPPRRGGRGWE